MTVLSCYFGLANITAQISPNEKEDQGDFTEILNSYKKGSYNESIKKLIPLTKITKFAPLAHYWLGLCHNKLQQFDQASLELQKALNFKNPPKDIYYELGQAHYAMNDFKKAKIYFKESVKQGVMKESSHYYLGFMEQNEENYSRALSEYRKIVGTLNQELPYKNKEVAQAAALQIAEVILFQAQKTSGKNEIVMVKEFVLPQLYRAQRIDQDSSLQAEISKKITDLKEKYDLDDGRMINGRRVPEKRVNAKFQEVFGYDTNVINEGDDAPSKVYPSRKASLVSRNQFFINKIYLFERRFQLIPEFRINYDYHLNRDEPEVIYFDMRNLTPKVEFYIEHSLFNSPAQTQVELEYFHSSRNVNKDKNMKFYSRAFTLSLAEKFKFFSYGDTTLRVRRREMDAYTELLNTQTDTINITQLFLFPKNHILILMLNIDWAKLPRNDLSSSNSYMLRGDYVYPHPLFLKLKPTFSFSFTLMDPLKQKPSRGLEKTLAPSIALNRSFNDTIEFGIRYDLTKNISKDKAFFAYTKNFIALEFNAKF
jgi:tetratricopeptide (TPR) repeat protein